MIEEPSDSQALTLVLAADAQAAAGEHPEIEQLLDYACGALDSGTESRIQTHLIGCRSCAQTLLDLRSFHQATDDADGEESVADLATAAAWRDFEARRDTAPVNPQVRHRRPRELYAAAALLVGFVSTSLWVVQLRQELETHSEPMLARSFPIQEALRSERPGAEVVELEPENQLVHFDIELPVRVPTYEIEILDAGGVSRWRDTAPAPSGSTRLSLLVPRRFLPEGDFRIVVRGGDAADRTVLIDKELRIRHM